MKFKALFIFVAIWSIIVYYPLAHMVWGKGILAELGSVDFAGRRRCCIYQFGNNSIGTCNYSWKKKYCYESDIQNTHIPFVVLATILFDGLDLLQEVPIADDLRRMHYDISYCIGVSSHDYG